MQIGFYIRYKDEILQELGEFNKENYPSSRPEFCNPPKPIREKKPKHPAESDERLPPQLRGRHFDSYWQICEAMGCPRCRKQAKIGGNYVSL